MTALACIALGFVAGVYFARWAVRAVDAERADRRISERRRADERVDYAFHRLDVAERDALRWKLRALRRGWKPWR